MNKRNDVKNRNNRVKWILITTFILVLLSFNVPVPYFIYIPGEAIELSPLVNVEASDEDEKGIFMLTTVSRLKGNVAFYIWSYVSPYAELIEKETILRGDETTEQYNHRQFYMMKDSKQDAIVAAYKAAGEKISYDNKGVYVISTSNGLPAEKVLKAGDIITHVEGQKITTANELLEKLRSYKAGDEIHFTFTRENKEYNEAIALQQLTDETGKSIGRAGIGITPVTERNLKLEREAEINTERIGGPSAGLMFSLELVDQLTKGDLAKGYRIAGTGTIDPDGNVGQIGGVHHKIVAADRKKADIFFVPKDIHPKTEQYDGDTNEHDAILMAKKIDTDMTIVPVATLSEALHYLNKLQPK